MDAPEECDHAGHGDRSAAADERHRDGSHEHHMTDDMGMKRGRGQLVWQDETGAEVGAPPLTPWSCIAHCVPAALQWQRKRLLRLGKRVFDPFWTLFRSQYGPSFESVFQVIHPLICRHITGSIVSGT